MTINGDPYNTAGYLNMCNKNIICLKVTNNTGSTQTINARVGMTPNYFNVVELGFFSFIGGTNHDYQVSDTYSAYEEKEFCIEFILLSPDYGSLQNRFGGNITPPSGPSDQTSTLYTMPNVDMTGIKYVSGDPILLSTAISNSLMLDPSISYTTDQFLYIDGTLQIDESYIFKGEMTFGPNAKIIVDPDLLFSLFEADLKGCYYMWGGIDINDAFVSLGGSSSIQDAAYGINIITDDPGNRTSLIVQNSHFLNNYIAIDVKESGNGAPSQHSIRLTASIFEANDVLKPVYDNEYPEIIIDAYAGLRVRNHSGITLRNPLTTPNVLFKGIANGIILDRAQLRIRDVNFENIQPSINYDVEGFSFANGSGIFSVQSFLYTDDAGPLHFTNVYAAITSWTTELNANGIEVEDSERGVNIISPWIHHSTVKNSNIESRRFGIRYILESHENSTFLFEGNSIIIGDPLENSGISGIHVNPLGLVQSKKYTPKIIDNTIELNNAQHGIFVRNIKGKRIAATMDYIGGGIDILTNEIDIIEDQAYDRSGIQIESSRFPYVCGNSISSDDNYGDYTIACDFRNSTDAEIRLNDLNYTKKGFQFWGNCLSPERLNYNFHRHHYIALCIGVDENNPVGVIGRQTKFRQNRWLNSPLNSGIHAANYEYDANGPSNPNYFQVFNFSNYLPSPQFPNDWIIGTGGEAQSTPEFCLEVYPIVMFNADDEEVAFDSITYSQFEEELRWSAKYELMIELYAMDSTNRATEYPIMDTFFHDNKNGSFGSFAAFTREMQQIASMSSAREDDLIGLYEDILDLLDDMLGYYGVSISDVPDSSDYVYNYSSLASLTPLKSELDSLKELILSEQDADYSTLSSQLSSLPDTLDIEYNLKYTLEATIEYMISHNLDSILTEFEDIDDIAALCPMEGGPGVYIARDLLVHEDIAYDDEGECMIAESRSRKFGEKQDQTHLINISIFPNPAHQNLTVKWEELEIELYQISIKDNSGRIIDFKLFPSVATGITQFNTGQFPNGIYFIHLESRDGTLIDTRKFTVTH